LSNELAPIQTASKSPAYMRLVSPFLLAYLFNLKPFISSTHILHFQAQCSLCFFSFFFLYLFIYL